MVAEDPAEPDLAACVPTPDSIVWRRASDLRLFLGSGYALLLQVAHPTVGAGVREHSIYAKDPAGRLIRTLDYMNALIYGGPEEAIRVARRLRRGHERIRGMTASGAPYHALEPGAFAWVHATLLEASVRGHALFGRAMDEDERERFYEGYRRLGRIHGVRERDLPETWRGFEAYFDEMVHTTLEANEAVRDLLRNMREPMSPARWLPERLWRVVRLPMTYLLNLGAIGMLPPVLRERFGVTFGPRKERELRVLAATLRAATPLLPGPIRISGPWYLRLRRHLGPGAEASPASGARGSA